jgi:heptaprenylglyceryl phosphate synthase
LYHHERQQRMKQFIYETLLAKKKRGQKSFAVLIDPDNVNAEKIEELTSSYISNASPIPADKNEIALCTAMAGEMLGMKLIYMDAGSGARHPIREEMIASVASHIEVPLVVGGGIRDPEKAYLNCKAGADVIVVGNAIEKETSLIREMAAAVHSVPVKEI